MQKTMTPKELSPLFSQLAMLLHAGAQPEEAVLQLQEDGAALQALSQRMETGFAAAVRDCGLFPAYAANMIAVGETAGRLEACLFSLADEYDRQVTLQKRVRSALLYPCVLLLLMCAVLAVLVFAVLPVFTGVYQELSGSLSGSSYAYVSAAGILSRVSLILTFAVTAAALILSAAAGESAFGLRIRAGLWRLPLLLDPLRMLAVSHASEVLSSLLLSGGSPELALQTAVDVNDHPGLQPVLEGCLRALHAGDSLDLALCPMYSAMQRRLLSVGAKSGNLAETLQQLARDTQEAGQEALFRRIDGLEPIFTAFLTVSVGFSLLSAMLPLAGILGSIG